MNGALSGSRRARIAPSGRLAGGRSAAVSRSAQLLLLAVTVSATAPHLAGQEGGDWRPAAARPPSLPRETRQQWERLTTWAAADDLRSAALLASRLQRYDGPGLTPGPDDAARQELADAVAGWLRAGSADLRSVHAQLSRPMGGEGDSTTDSAAQLRLLAARGREGGADVPTITALALAGEVALSRGDPQTARRAWYDALAWSDALPEPELRRELRPTPVELHSWLAVAALRADDLFAARTELAELARAEPTATGRLAGTERPLVAYLTELCDAAAAERAARSQRLMRSAFRQTWSVSLATLAPTSPETAEEGASAPGMAALAVTSVAWSNDTAVVRRGEALAAFAARDGALLWRTSLADDGVHAPASLAPVSAALALADQRLCARTAAGRVACLDLTRGGAVAWLGAAPASAAPLDGGAPVVCDRNVVFAELRAGALVDLELAACDVATGREAWRRSLGAGDVPRAQNRQAAAPPELCADCGAAYLCSQLGYVAAVEAPTGRVRWWRAYPRTNRAPTSTAPRLALRDGGTIALCGNLVVAAPLDAAEAFAWDAATGALRWRTPLPSPQARILGSGGGKLWWGAERLWACDLRDGAWAAGLGAAAEGGAGGGWVAGGGVFWPRSGQIDILEASAGLLAASSWEVSDAPRVRLAADALGLRVAAATTTELTAWARIPGARETTGAADPRAPADDAPERAKGTP